MSTDENKCFIVNNGHDCISFCYLSPYDKNSQIKCRVKTETSMYMEKIITRKTEIFRKLTPYRISLPCHFMKRWHLVLTYVSIMKLQCTHFIVYQSYLIDLSTDKAKRKKPFLWCLIKIWMNHTHFCIWS